MLGVDLTHVAAVAWHLIFDLALVLILQGPCLVQVLELHVLLVVDLHRALGAYLAVERTGCFQDVVPHRVGQAVARSCLVLSGKGCFQDVLVLVLEQALDLVSVRPVLAPRTLPLVLAQPVLHQTSALQARLQVLDPQVSQPLLVRPVLRQAAVLPALDLLPGLLVVPF